MQEDLKHHRALLKLFAFKSIVGLQFIQDILFTFLAEYRVYTPTEYVSYEDFTTGIPNFILCWELFGFSLLFIKAFEYHPYRVKVQEGHPVQKSVRRAFLDSMNVLHIFTACRFLLSGHLILHDHGTAKIEDARTSSVTKETPVAVAASDDVESARRNES